MNRVTFVFVALMVLLLAGRVEARDREISFVGGGAPTVAEHGPEDVVVIGSDRPATFRDGDSLDLVAKIWNVRVGKVVQSTRIGALRAYPSDDWGYTGRPGSAVRAHGRTFLLTDGASDADPEARFLEIDDALRVVREERVGIFGYASFVVDGDVIVTAALQAVRASSSGSGDHIHITVRDRRTYRIVAARTLYASNRISIENRRPFAIARGELYLGFAADDRTRIVRMQLPSLRIDAERSYPGDAPTLCALDDRLVAIDRGVLAELDFDLSRELRRFDDVAAEILVRDPTRGRLAADDVVPRGFTPRVVSTGPHVWGDTIGWTALGAVAVRRNALNVVVVTDPRR